MRDRDLVLPKLGGKRWSLDHGWKFHFGDIPFPQIRGHRESYQNAKAGKAWGAAAPDYDDTLWQELDLPHDWAVEGAFEPEANVAQGYRVRGIGWYRRHLALSASERGQHLELQFDGVATHCTVWVNGVLAHRNWCGYTSFYIDITPLVTFGDELNVIAVRVDAQAMEGWWYEGAGLYRHSWLVTRDPTHFLTDGIYANPVCRNDTTWEIPIEALVTNSGTKTEQLAVEFHLFSPTQELVVHSATEIVLRPLEERALVANLAVLYPQALVPRPARALSAPSDDSS